MKKIIFIMFALSFLLTACAGQLSTYDENSFGSMGFDVEDPVEIGVNYLSNGVKLSVVLNYDAAKSIIGQISYDENSFDLSYETQSEDLCKYNPENKKVACASTTSLDTGTLYTFTLKAKPGKPAGDYPLNFKIVEIDGTNPDVDLNTFISLSGTQN
ncbi:hypothetical protein K9L97_00555 [Candidatus Woesearchaeota archaeon]|nr:hypothetical protein [Candidatus Woesearchaeota archaeon]